MKNTTRYLILAAVLVVVVGSILYIDSSRIDTAVIRKEASIENIDESVEKEMMYRKAKEIVRPAGYVNTDMITVSELIGEKVILIDFMTYSCINCQRTYPYLNAWWDKYEDQGLQILGIHTPEFEFEKDIENVKDAAERFGLKFPLVLDNDYGTWRAYGNRYWPRKYLIDIDGYIVYDHIGEGAYDEAEKKIQELLKERNEKLNTGLEISTGMVAPKDVETVFTEYPRSPEIYFGSLRNSRYLANGKAGVAGVQNFLEPDEIEENDLYLAGEWDIQPEYSESNKAGAKIIFRYMAEKVFIVARSDNEVKMTILRDGEAYSEVNIKEDKLYRLVEDPEGYGMHTLELIVEEPGVQVFTFTFG